MLPTAARLRNSAEFRSIVRHGVRVGRPTLVVHADLAEHAPRGNTREPTSTKVGFVVSKKVGNAVTRNRVKRRLRHMARARVVASTADVPLPGALRVVVRALPAAATEPKRLAGDFDSAWDRALARLTPAPSAAGTSPSGGAR
ncbi:ribonuclease P protein component [Propionibacterium freudenreichii]|uniref:ribonuclease P protein component n=1 Tax=Propionibacterium freudenreichii TaxID=1744 RepID=UPI0021A8D785|nr:ribonuclease P protein component [Propionibacterium freudenreichii]MCT3013475.1 ribonuclease P protein component [Propionibacterium freudenreichii]